MCRISEQRFQGHIFYRKKKLNLFENIIKKVLLLMTFFYRSFLHSKIFDARGTRFGFGFDYG